VQLVNSLKRLREWHTPIGSMQVENIYTISPQLLQTCFELLVELFWLVRSGHRRVHFGSNAKATVFVACLPRERFLFAANVASSCVNFIMACFLEVIEECLELLYRGDTCSFGLLDSR
jgi:hypothetical protein